MVSILPHGGGRAGYPPGTRSCRACAEVLRAIVPACSPLMRSCAEPVTELHQTATRRPEPLRVALAARRPTGADARDPAPPGHVGDPADRGREVRDLPDSGDPAGRTDGGHLAAAGPAARPPGRADRPRTGRGTGQLRGDADPAPHGAPR